MKRLLAATALLAWQFAAHAGLQVDVGETGLRVLAYDGQALVSAGRGAEIRVFNHTPRIARPDGTQFVSEDKPTVRSPRPWQVVREYSWGMVECSYSTDGERLAFDLRITNSSAANTISALDLHLAEISFPSVPEGRSTDAGMFGMGGGWRALNQSPLSADPTQMPPVLFVRYGGAMLAFATEGPAALPTPAIPFTSTPASKLAYPFTVSFSTIPPRGSITARAWLRFSGPDTDDRLAGEVFRSFRERYPMTLAWSDRRPIGALFLATSQTHPPANPRGWFLNAGDIDVTTPDGVARWRERLMKYADTAIKVLQDINAQGMITWDPEGQQYAAAAFYGDPRLAATLAPETEFRGRSMLGALDEYFQKFRDAGFATGILIRPQAITLKDGVPAQTAAASPRDELLAKIEYARARWGCTLFYVDSSYDAAGALNADVFREILERHPDILVLPENEVFRHFAYGAPLNSFHHHGVTATPAPVRAVYPEAFSGLMVTTTEDKMRAGRDALLDAVRQGDVLIVNAWYAGKHTEFVKGLYRDAGR